MDLLKLKRFYCYLLLIASVWGLTACSPNDDPGYRPQPTEQTVIMFYPWSTNLLSYFHKNIEDFTRTIEERGLVKERVLVCIASSPTRADLLELRYDLHTRKCVVDTLRTYEKQEFTTEADIRKMLDDVKSISHSPRYSMIIGCHGMGWLPVEHATSRMQSVRYHYYDVPGAPLTRYFGGLSSEYQIEIKTLANSIAGAGMKMDYILFDDCYMATVEVAYDLKEVTDYLIACPTEIMAYGFPYHQCGRYLLGTPDYQGVIDAFYSFYSTYTYPYGTAAVIDCSRVEALAGVVRQINAISDPSSVDRSDLQVMDGYRPTIFYDMGDYISRLCPDPALLEQFKVQVAKAVPYKCHTKEFFTAFQGGHTIPVRTYAGITISDPSVHRLAVNTVSNTAWYRATH